MEGDMARFTGETGFKFNMVRISAVTKLEENLLLL